MAHETLTLRSLMQQFLDWLEREVQLHRAEPLTVVYYRQQLHQFVKAAGGERLIADLTAWDLESRKTSWHQVQCVQRLFNWAVDVGFAPVNPFAGVGRPPKGERQRIFTPAELARLLRKSLRPLRRILIAIHITLGRPQELRGVRWADYRSDIKAFVLKEFKGRKRRKDKVRYRVLPVLPRLARMLERLRRRSPTATEYVFLNGRGKPWTTSALRQAVRKACARAGLDVADRERLVAYSLRHTAATQATANGIADRLLADLLGHADTRTTARYQHLQVDHLHRAAEIASRRTR